MSGSLLDIEMFRCAHAQRTLRQAQGTGIWCCPHSQSALQSVNRLLSLSKHRFTDPVPGQSAYGQCNGSRSQSLRCSAALTHSGPCGQHDNLLVAGYSVNKRTLRQAQGTGICCCPHSQSALWVGRSVSEIFKDDRCTSHARSWAKQLQFSSPLVFSGS